MDYQSHLVRAYDEGTYIGRAMHVLVTHNPQEGTFYDHPYFGQLFLAGMLWIAGYPNSMHPSADGDVLHGVEMLWLLPRLLIGFLGVIDTFLVYKISERRYSIKVAFIASILFAVMPSIWLLRTIFLESLQLPLVLSSILFAVIANNSGKINNEKKNLSMTLLSAIFMGLDIFTKVTVFTMIPLGVFLIYINNYKKMKIVGLWFIPVVLIPLIWPVYAISLGQFDQWWDGIYWQTHRQTGGSVLEADRQMTLSNSIAKNFLKMPLLLGLGFAGLVFAAIKKDFFLIIWAIPFLIFLYFIGFVRDFHVIPLLPVLCISAAKFIEGLSNKITYRKVHEVLPFSIISAIAIFGLINVMIQLTTHNNDNKFAAAAFVTRYLHDNKRDNITIISNHVYSWIPKYVFHLGNDYMIPEIDAIETTPKTKKVLLVVDGAFKNVLSGDDEVAQRLQRIYSLHSKNGTTTVDVGKDKIILPQPWSYGSAQEIGTNLLNKENIWRPYGGARVSQTDHSLNIFVKTNNTDKVSSNAILKTQLKNVTERPLLLSLDYASKSSKGNGKFYVEIRYGDDLNNIYFKRALMDTSGNVTNQLFILPSQIVDKLVEFRLRIITDTAGVHPMTVKRASIIFSVLG